MLRKLVALIFRSPITDADLAFEKIIQEVMDGLYAVLAEKYKNADGSPRYTEEYVRSCAPMVRACVMRNIANNLARFPLSGRTGAITGPAWDLYCRKLESR